jgi:hypothetical protein
MSDKPDIPSLLEYARHYWKPKYTDLRYLSTMMKRVEKECKPKYNIEMKDSDPAFDVGDDFTESMTLKPDKHDGAMCPLWYGWAIRKAFWAGVNWQRAQKEDK